MYLHLNKKTEIMEQNQIVEHSDFRKGNLEKVGGPISLEKVRLWTNNYRKINDKDITTSHFFGREVIEKILAQTGCVGIRIHYAVDDRNHKQLILSGVDKTGKDQQPNRVHKTHENTIHLAATAQPAAAAANNDYELYDQSWPCPGTNGCPSNDLNS